MKKTSLNEVHKKQLGKMVPFAGYEMPVQYDEGMLKEHNWVRQGNVGLFDVSHMGQFILKGNNPAEFLNKITPSNFKITKEGSAKYTVLTNENGGIVDDLIITKFSDNEFFIVLNAACKEKDVSHINKYLPQGLTFEEIENRSLIAIQGEGAEKILQKFVTDKELSELPYMNSQKIVITNNNDEVQAEAIANDPNSTKPYAQIVDGHEGEYYKTETIISRTGYTGEDGFEVSIGSEYAAKFWTDLCSFDEVKPIGLGARDSLRLEMGYPLYGHDLNDDTSPVEAGIAWTVSKTNNDFLGSQRILKEKNSSQISKLRFGVKLLDKGIAREGAEVYQNSTKIGELTSGGFSPQLKVSIGQGYFDPNIVKIGDKVVVKVRNKDIEAEISSVSFVEAKTKSAKKLFVV